MPVDPEKMAIRVVLKNGQVAEFDPTFVSRIEMDVNETCWWINPPQRVSWLGNAERAEISGMSSPHSRTPIIGPVVGNSWYLSDLANGWKPGLPVDWDEKGEAIFLARHAHVHSKIDGACLKNRDQVECDAPRRGPLHG